MRAAGAALAIGLAFLVSSCGGGGGGNSAPPPVDVDAQLAAAGPRTCSVADQRSWLGNYMRDQYFWPDRLGIPNAAATSIDAYFQSLLYQPVDRFSFTQSAAEYSQFFVEGTRTGYGYSLVFEDGGSTLRVRITEPASPVARAGLKRGERVLAIDGKTPQQIANGELPTVTTAGVARSFVVQNAAGATRSFSVVSAKYFVTPVQGSRIIEVPTPSGVRKVGYILYQEFIQSSQWELGLELDYLMEQGATELVLDLRYNGGGSVEVARMVGSFIGRSRTAGQTFAQLLFNARHPEKNFSFMFAGAAELPVSTMEGVQRAFIITSGNTASASELVINALKPFMPVVLVGGTTFGKPYGFETRQACGTAFLAVNFETVNAVGEGGYTSGFAPDCAAPDDLGHALGDASEARLSAALHYVANGSCPPSAQALRGRSVLEPAAIGDAAPSGMWR